MTNSKKHHVFRPEWVAKQVQNYGSKPDHARPSLYHLWTAPEMECRRDQIEVWVDCLPENKRHGMIRRLQTPEKFRHAANELVIAASLRKIGYHADYEPELGGLTPDWVFSRTSVRFIVEVVSSSLSDERIRCDEGWERLRLRIQEIKGSAFLAVRIPFGLDDGQEVPPPPDEEQKKIAEEVQRWLVRETKENDPLVIGDLSITFEGTFPGLCNVSCSLGLNGFMVTSAPMRKSIASKASKYRQMVEQLRLPFIVAVFPSFGSGRGIEELKEVAFGTPRIRLVLSNGKRREQHWRESNGLFKKYPTLAAVTFCEETTTGVTQKLLRNPSAIYSVEEDALEHG